MITQCWTQRDHEGFGNRVERANRHTQTQAQRIPATVAGITVGRAEVVVQNLVTQIGHARENMREILEMEFRS